VRRPRLGRGIERSGKNAEQKTPAAKHRLRQRGRDIFTASGQANKQGFSGEAVLSGQADKLGMSRIWEGLKGEMVESVGEIGFG
jgi:hypothetical protein